MHVCRHCDGTTLCIAAAPADAIAIVVIAQPTHLGFQDHLANTLLPLLLDTRRLLCPHGRMARSAKDRDARQAKHEALDTKGATFRRVLTRSTLLSVHAPAGALLLRFDFNATQRSEGHSNSQR